MSMRLKADDLLAIYKAVTKLEDSELHAEVLVVGEHKIMLQKSDDGEHIIVGITRENFSKVMRGVADMMEKGKINMEPGQTGASGYGRSYHNPTPQTPA